MAGWTGLEPATSGVTGRRSNQLNYHPLRNSTSTKFIVQSKIKVPILTLNFELSTVNCYFW